MHVKEVMIEATHTSDEERVTFPEVVKNLMQADVERYHADLLRAKGLTICPTANPK
jgi:hypothetical protein